MLNIFTEFTNWIVPFKFLFMFMQINTHLWGLTTYCVCLSTWNKVSLATVFKISKMFSLTVLFLHKLYTHYATFSKRNQQFIQMLIKIHGYNSKVNFITTIGLIRKFVHIWTRTHQVVVLLGELDLGVTMATEVRQHYT